MVRIFILLQEEESKKGEQDIKLQELNARRFLSSGKKQNSVEVLKSKINIPPL